jgi:F420-0:gamma-glutamyl ligase-like protein
VVEIREDLHRKIHKQAILNDIKIYQLTNAIMEEFLKDEEHMKALIKRLKI